MASSSAIARPPTDGLAWPIDPDAPSFILPAWLASTAVGAASGAAIGFGSNQSPTTYSARMGMRWSLATLGFFGIREYLVSPTLLLLSPTFSHTRRYITLTAKARGKLPESNPGFDDASTLHDLRWNRFLDTFIAGGVTGGGVMSILRGSFATFPRAAFTSGVLFSLVQLTTNQIRVLRIRYLASDTSPAQTSSSSTSSSPTFTQTIQNPQKQLDPSGRDLSTGENSLSARILSWMGKVTPISKISDEEYLARMEGRAEEIKKRLEGIEREEEVIYSRTQEGG